MTHRIIRTSAVVTATAGLLLASIGAADAQTVHDQDTLGDVVQFSDAGQEATPVPAQDNGDITRTRLWHARKVGVVVHFASLERVGALRGDFLQIVTDEGIHRRVVVLSQPGDWAGATYVFNRNDDEVACTGVTHKIDYKAGTVTIRVPRSCLSNPRWVKLGFGSGVVADGGAGSETFDDALRHDPVSSDDPDLKMTARIRRTG
jgi:hypothetical protein